MTRWVVERDRWQGYRLYQIDKFEYANDLTVACFEATEHEAQCVLNLFRGV